MNKKKLIPLFLLAASGIAFSSCDQKQEKVEEVAPPVVTSPETIAPEAPSEEEILYEEVMVVHDEAMAKMGTIRRLSRQLKDSIENTNANPMEQEEMINLYRNRLKELKDADGAMRVWMREFSAEGDSLKGAERITYLKEEKVAMEEVAGQMEKAIAEAREALKE